MDENEKNTYRGQLHINAEALKKVADAMFQGDISECKAPDVKHARELLTRVIYLESIAPGFLTEFLDTFSQHFTALFEKKVIAERALEAAKSAGCESEYLDALRAGEDPKKAGQVPALVKLVMKKDGVSQVEAIAAVSEKTGRDRDSVERVVRRAKNRRT